MRELREYVDTGWSGAKASRPELDWLMQDTRTRWFDAVLVWKMDRWGRSVAGCIRTIQELASSGVRFLAVTQDLDTDESSPMSRLLLHFLAAFAEFEPEIDSGAGDCGDSDRQNQGRINWASRFRP